MGAEDTTGTFHVGTYPWKGLGKELEEKVGATWIWRDLPPPRQSVGIAESEDLGKGVLIPRHSGLAA